MGRLFFPGRGWLRLSLTQTTLRMIVNSDAPDSILACGREILRIVVNHLGGVKLDGKPLAPEWAADYAAVLRLTRADFDRKGRAVSDKLLHQNAVAFYRPQPSEGASRTSRSSR